VKLHYRKIGSAPTTIIVPYGAMFEDFRALADVATVIAYDPRNRGRSQTLSDLSSLSMQREVDDFEAVRAHFNADRVIPVGWSYLGAMVALYASQHPEHVSRLVQIGPIGRSASLKFEAHTDAVSIPPSADKCEAAWQNLANRLVGDPSHASRLRSTCDQPNESEEHLAGHFAKLWPSIEQTEFTAVQIAKITMPLLTIHGTWDRNAAYGYGRDWAQSLPNARLLTVPHAAHAVWVDDPALVFGAIRQFLRGEWPLTAEKVTLD
jgi:proline iminopeptidase